MQYTASSFAEPVIRPFIDVFKREAHKTDPDGYFPSAASSEEHLGDRADSAFRWLVDAFVGAMGSVLVFERGGSRRYLVYVLVTLVTLLFWQLALRN
jgi:hypothetical protein